MIRYVCDNCGLVENAKTGINGESVRPKEIIVIQKDRRQYHACSNHCVDAIERREIEKNSFLTEQ